MRSDMEILADPIKKLHSRHRLAKTWFEEALLLTPDSVNLERGVVEQAGLECVARMRTEYRSIFAKGLGVSRDLATVRKVCREFWLRARRPA